MDKLAQSQVDKDLVAKHEQELKEYRLKDKIHRLRNSSTNDQGYKKTRRKCNRIC